MLCNVPEAFLHDNGAAKLKRFCRGVWTRALASSRQRDDKTTDSPANQRNGMTAAPVGTWGEPRRQAVKRIAGVSVKIGFRSESGQFWECSALERNAMQRKISGATKSWPVSRLMLVACTGRSLAVHIALPSAIGNASRRIAGLGRTKSRGHFFEPPRARGCCTSGEPAAQQGFAAASREAARSLQFVHLWARPVSSGLASF